MARLHSCILVEHPSLAVNLQLASTTIHGGWESKASDNSSHQSSSLLVFQLKLEALWSFSNERDWIRTVSLQKVKPLASAQTWWLEQTKFQLPLAPSVRPPHVVNNLNNHTQPPLLSSSKPMGSHLDYDNSFSVYYLILPPFLLPFNLPCMLLPKYKYSGAWNPMMTLHFIENKFQIP